MNSLGTSPMRETSKKTRETEDKRRQIITSKLLSDILDAHALNKFGSELMKRDQHLEEFTETFLTGGTKNMASGGCAEGTKMQGSDSDVMNIIRGVSVVKPHEHISDVAIELVMRTDGCGPGHVTLEVGKVDYSVEVPIDPYCIMLISNLRYFLLRCGNRQYISSDKFKEKMNVQGYMMPDNFTDKGITVSGPAHKNKTLLGEVDYVTALECHNWPEPARDWITRPRMNQWPREEFLQTLQRKCQCYIVPKGDESSVDAGMQWRISFVSIERELIWHMNDIQLKCFIILKILLKSIEQNIPENSLKTYHLKNTIFWLLEETPAGMWIESMLISRVRDCIQKLIDYVRERILPQYLLPGNNLFKNRFKTAADKAKTITSLINVSKNVLQVIRAGLEYRNVPVKHMMDKEYWYNRYKVRIDNDFGNFIIYISSINNSYPTRIREYQDVFLRQFPGEAEHFMPSINIAIARASYIEQLSTKGVGRVSRGTVDKYIKNASITDPLRACIYTALFDFHDERYSKIQKGLESEANDVLKTNKQNLQDVRLSVVDNYYVPNVIFFEQILKGSRWFMKYDQLVLAYVLIFLSEFRLGHKKECVRIMRILPLIIDSIKEHQDHFVHLNCLGYCYVLLGKSALAFKTFCRSLQQFHSVVNAAAYHIAFMVNKTNLVCRSGSDRIRI